MVSDESEAVVVVKFDPRDSDFREVMDALREFFAARTEEPPREVFGAIHGHARRVLEVFEDDA